MKLMTMTQVTVDGVMQGNGGASDEDRRSGFERGGWAMGVFDDETMAFITETYQRAEAFLFGRRTYELFAGYWGETEMRAHPIGVALNETPKYVATTAFTAAGATLRMAAQVRPAQRGFVDAEVRRRLATALAEAGVEIRAARFPEPAA